MSTKTIRELFDAALLLPADQRQAWLDTQTSDPEVRARVAALLIAEDSDSSILDRPLALQLHALAQAETTALADDSKGASANSSTLIGTEIEGYRLISLLGQGGMASVFAATRLGADFEQQVAVKLLRRNLHSELEQRLFQRERQALASLEHPNIARLLDGGVTDAGVPYLVMELVQGVDLLTFARQRNLSLRARLALFAQVCDAVNAAHRALFVHRDIKPGNIMVNKSGQAKLLDFGIAKILNEQGEQTSTQTATFAPLTPEYAAPEQFDGSPITTATDVFGLGIVLHELLIGVRPERALGQGCSTRASDLVTTQTTLAPAKTPINHLELKRFLRGDIDNILGQSLSTAPNERYASAGELAADLRRFLDGLPVQAHPPSSWYRTKKFVRRNVWAVALCSVLLLGLIGSLVFALQQAQIARAQSTSAQLQAKRAEATRDFLVQMFRAAEPQTDTSARLTVIDFTQQAAQQLQWEINLPAPVKAELQSVLGSVLVNQGDAKTGLNLLQAAIKASQIGDFSEQAKFQLTENYIESLVRSGTPEPGLKALIDYEASKPKLSDINLARLLALRAQAHSKLEDDAAATKAAAEAMALCALANSCDIQTQLRVLEASAIVHATFNRNIEAAQNYQQLRVFTATRYGNISVQMASALNGLAGALRRLERFDDAAILMQQVQAIDDKTLPDFHVSRAVHLNFLGLLQVDMRNYQAAAITLTKALRVSEKLATSETDISLDVQNLAMIQARLGQFDLAQAGLSRALASYEKLFGASDIRTTLPRSNLSHVLALQGNLAAAIPMMQKTLADMRKSDKPNPFLFQQNLMKYAQQQLWARNFNEASKAVIEAEQVIRELGTNAAPSTIRPFKLLRALIAFETQQFAAAELQITDLAPSFANEKYASASEIEFRLLQGQIALQRGDKPGALAALQLAEKLMAIHDAVYGYLQVRHDRLSGLLH